VGFKPVIFKKQILTILTIFIKMISDVITFFTFT